MYSTLTGLDYVKFLLKKMKKELSIRLDKTTEGHTAKKHNCPACNKKRFVKYYDFEKLEYLDERYGRCDREEACGYFLSPFADLKEQNQSEYKARAYTPPPPAPVKINFVPKETLISSLRAYESNTFVEFLKSKLGELRAMELVFDYYIGTAKANGTIFWQVDQFLRCRTGQKIHYDETGHRIKEIEPKRLFLVEKDFRPCMFGEHLLFTKNANALVAIVESEKSAIICSAYMPYLGTRQIIWMACSGANGLTEEKIQCLRGKEILLVPDFSFHARATWGAELMRKKLVPQIVQGVEKMITRIHPEGDVQEDYVSAKMKLEAIGCSVRFYDPYPEIVDGSDLADIFVGMPAPVVYDVPDFSALDLDQGKIKSSEDKKDVSGTFVLDRRRKFKISANDSEKISVSVSPDILKEKMDKFVNNPMFRKLMKKFDLCEEGTVGPLDML